MMKNQKNERTYRTKGIFPLAATIGGLTLGVVLGLPLVVDHSDQIFHNRIYKDFKKIENYYDKNKDGVLSIEEKYFMYSNFDLENKPSSYVPTINEMKNIVEKYQEIDKNQFGIFDSLPVTSLEDSL
jgi:hypothetical protein